MQTAFSPLATICQCQLEASRRFSEALLSGTEKIDRVFLDAGHRMFIRQLKLVQTVTSAHDPQSAVSALQAGLAPRGPEEIVNYQQECMHVMVEMQHAFSESLQDYIAQLGRHVPFNAGAASLSPSPAAAGSMVAAGFKTSGNGMANPMAGLFSMWETAFREIAAFTQKNLLTARTTMEEAATQQAMSGAGKAAMTVATGMHDGGETHMATSGSHRRSHADDADDEDKKRNGSGRRK